MTVPDPILRITDGTTVINLLSKGYGFHLKEWTPTISEPKGGGVFSSSSLIDGRRLSQRVYDNAVEVITLAINAPAQDIAIFYTQELRRLLTKAHQYWTTEWQNEPVWLEARGPYETETRYAVIIDWRFQEDDDPYQQPFFSSIATLDELTLAIEREHWTSNPPGQLECLSISSVDSAALYTSAGPYTPSASADDAFVNHNTSTIDTSGTIMQIGGDGSNWWDALMRFINVTIPAGSIITSAYITLTASASKSGNMIVHIIGEKTSAPATFSTYANYTGRTLTGNSVIWTVVDNWILNSTYNTPDISDIIQEIIDLPGWSSGNNMALFIKGSKLELYYRNIWTVDASFEPELYVTYRASSEDFGQETTCDGDSVFVANKHNTAQITNVYLYEDGVGYTDLLAASLPYYLLPSGATTVDYLYIGVDSSVANGGPFCSVVFDLSDFLAGVTANWEYSDTAGPTFSTLASVIQDNTDELQVTGINSLHFVPPSDWTPAQINGVTGYWIRLNISAGTETNLPEQQNRHPYTVIRPYFLIESDQIEGDISSLIQVIIRNRSYKASATDALVGGVHIGARSVERGEEFSAYFNVSDEQHQEGVSAAAGGSTNIVAEITAPTGRSGYYNPTGATAMATQITWTIASPYTRQYPGRYRAFVRYRQDGGSDGDFTARIGYRVQNANTRYTESSTLHKPSAAGTTAVAEIGQVVFPPVGDEDIGSLYLYLQAANTNGSPGDIYFIDVILLPYDEFAGTYTSTTLTSADKLTLDKAIKIDSVSIPKSKARAPSIDVADNNKIRSYWNVIANNIPNLNPRQAMKVWFLFDEGEVSGDNYIKSKIIMSASITANKVQRYLSMRGSR